MRVHVAPLTARAPTAIAHHDCLQLIVEDEQLGGDVGLNVIAADERDHLAPGETFDGGDEIGFHRLISIQMVQLVLQYTGRGPTKARTTIDPNFVLVVLDDTLTRSERSLLAAREEDLIRQQRRRLHELMREEAIAIVERGVGQKVRAFLGDVSPAEGVAVAVFLLEPSTSRWTAATPLVGMAHLHRVQATGDSAPEPLCGVLRSERGEFMRWP